MKKKRKKKKIIVLSIIVAVLVIGGYLLFSRDKSPSYDFILVQRGEIIQEVSVTGKVKPAESVDLAFEDTGKVFGVYVKVGDKVADGQPLVKLENAEIAAQLAQAQADLKAQEAKLEELERGTREEEIRVQEVKVQNARISVEDAVKNLIDKLQDAYTKSDDAVRNKSDQFFKTPAIPVPQIDFSIPDFQLEIDLEWARSQVETTLKSWKSFLDQLTVSSDFDQHITVAEESLSQIKSFLDKASLALSSASAGSELSQTTLDSWRSDISTARTNVNTAISNISAAEEKLRTNEASLTLAEQELNLKKAGSTPEEIKAQEAKVEQAQASVLNYEAQLAKTILRSPINGVITKQDTKAGEIVSSGSTVVSVISTAKFEIEANVAEADIAKIKVGNQAKVTLDAYGENVVFEVKVVEIDPAETVIEGVTTYKTTFQFMEDDERVKSGMTANIDIMADKRENAVIVPRRVVTTRNGDKLVNLLTDAGLVETKVEIGLIGSDGNVEITKGLKQGDKVIVSSLGK